MPKITKYTKKDGSSAYMFKLYFGRDKVTGKRLQTTRRGFETEKLARLTMDKLELEFENKKIATSQSATFQDIYDDYFPKYKNTVKESTWCKTQQNYKNHVLPIFGDTQLKKITPQQCQNAVDKWFGQKLTSIRSSFI